MRTNSEEIKQKVETLNKISNKELGKNIIDTQKKNLKGIVMGSLLGLVSSIALSQKPLYGIIIGAIVGKIFIAKKI